MNWGQCPICKSRGFMDHHKCPPRWECVNAEAVNYADEQDCWHEVYAPDAKEAAETFAAWDDGWSAEYSSEREVAVRSRHGTVEMYDVLLESMPVYTASKKAETETVCTSKESS